MTFAAIAVTTSIAMMLAVPLSAQVVAPIAPVAQSNPAATASATAAKTEQDVLTAERARFAAMVKADAGALDKLLGPELSYTHSNAQVQDKAGFIGDIKIGNIKYLSIDPTDTHVQLFENMAIVTGAAGVHVIQAGNDLSIKIRYTNVQVNRRGEWQMVAWEATRVP